MAASTALRKRGTPDRRVDGPVRAAPSAVAPADPIAGVLDLQRLAGNGAVTAWLAGEAGATLVRSPRGLAPGTRLAVARQAAGAPSPRRRTPARPKKIVGKSTIALGSDSDIFTFAAFFAIATSPSALATGRFDSGVVFSSVKLERTWERLVWAISVVADPRRKSEIEQATQIWDESRDTVSGVLASARAKGFDTTEASTGFARFEKQLVRFEASELRSRAEADVHLASPDEALNRDVDKQLGEYFFALRKVIKEAEGIVQWNDRTLYRMVTATGVGQITDAQLKVANYGRTIIGWASLWEEYDTLDKRLDAAAKKGLLAKASTIADFTSKATTVGAESFNAFIGIFEGQAKLRAAAWAKLGNLSQGSKLRIPSPSMAISAEEVGQTKWLNYAKQLKNFTRFASGLAGAISLVSGFLSLAKAIHEDDVRGIVAAGHSIAQGGVTLGGAALGSGAAATAFVSGGLTVAWVTIEALFDIAELSAWGRRQAKIKEIAGPLKGAASLIPWGKRMGGVADAFVQNDARDPSLRAAIEEQLVKNGTEPFNIVLKGMLGVDDFISSRGDLQIAFGPTGMHALQQLRLMQFRDASEPVAPGDIQLLTDWATPIYEGLNRVGKWAVDTYGEHRNDAAVVKERVGIEMAGVGGR